ncbi:excinuclease ABC subunit UvrB [Thermospira aquatica]|uniref:UvrABC system protein B n=1 Tax=Thermospira aquatica TaxID=2828656 RepID=A0AAX3BCL4_9SPIR|nr:excinuclease ABC subunit UvrB [Thermospira aquatica]URA10034.1 excinuclease ABC subunit UvrB [Thermospira aquatica]
MPAFRVHAPFQPAGDQPKAIEALVKNFQEGKKRQVLLGVTGSGKTFTMAHVIQALQYPTLIMSHNKTLAAQLYREFRDFFPENAVEYFVSYYDYYQPEAYVPQRDLYIEKDASINDEIDRMRVSAVASLMDRHDVIVVASVSCIYGLGAPTDYKELMLLLKKGMIRDRESILSHLVQIQYEKADIELNRASFRVKGDVIDIHTAYSREVIRIEMFGDEIESIKRLHLITGNLIEELDRIVIYPAKLFLTTQDKLKLAIESIEAELAQRVAELKAENKTLEAYRLETRTRYDIEMLSELGYCNGIENYSRHLSFRKPGERPFVLLDYFPRPFLTILDESHQTIPQINGMFHGDYSRKKTLVDFGFRLPSALDNRPLRFEEFDTLLDHVMYVSATPAEYELTHSEAIVEQIIRPTGLIDPEVEVRPTTGQIEDIIREVQLRIQEGERTIITTLTKKMAEDLTQYLLDQNMKVAYIHSEVETIERVEILKKLRMGIYDVIVGINLLREGIDLPEVSLVIILDADKMGFLRSARSLIQIIGRSARHVNGKVIMYADNITESMAEAIRETYRRRELQLEYNRIHNITPTSVRKEIADILERKLKETEEKADELEKLKRSIPDKKRLIQEMEKLMFQYAESLEFEKAAFVRDQIEEIKHSTTIE